MRILVVDDSEDSRDLTEAALLSAGYKEVYTAASAWEAFKFLDIGKSASSEPVPIDIVLLDILMPEIDGIEACARIRNDDRYGDIPIIMVTSLTDMDSLANAFVAGASDYITKPVNRIELLARVRAALKLKAELERRQERERELLAFMSKWGDRRAKMWIDDATGLFVGEVAEAYLTAATAAPNDELVSIVTLAIDRLDVYRAAQGEQVSRAILAAVAKAIRSTTAAIGVIAASYRNGLIVLIVPEIDAKPAAELARSLCASVSRLAILNTESIAADHVTASAAVATGRTKRSADRVKLLTQAIAAVQDAAAAGGNRVVNV